MTDQNKRYRLPDWQASMGEYDPGQIKVKVKGLEDAPIIFACKTYGFCVYLKKESGNYTPTIFFSDEIEIEKPEEWKDANSLRI